MPDKVKPVISPDLIERVRNATGPSAVLDAELYATVGGAPHTTTAGARTVPLVLKGDPTAWPAYTASIDAALALVERVLPGWVVTVATFHTDYGSAYADMASRRYIESQEGFEHEYAESAGETAPLAIILASLSALNAPPAGGQRCRIR